MSMRVLPFSQAVKRICRQKGLDLSLKGPVARLGLSLATTQRGVIDPHDTLHYAYRNLAFAVGFTQPEDRDLLYRTFSLVEEGHRGQTRESGHPYLLHPIAVAEELVRLGLGIEDICAGEGHDLIEQGKVNGQRITKELIIEKLGAAVAVKIDGVTELGKEPSFVKSASGTVGLVDIYKKLLAYGLADLAVLIIKIEDRLHNMRTLEYKKELEKRREKAEETLRIYVPLANILGLWPIKTELENLSFRYLEPEKHRDYSVKMAEVLSGSKSQLEQVIGLIRGRFEGEEFPARVSLEVRGVYDLYQRMQDHKISLEDMSPADISRISLVVPTEKTELNCYQALFVVHSLFRSRQGYFRDYISEPRPNSHRFLHTWVRVRRFGELLVQVRNESMRMANEKGILVQEDWQGKGAEFVGAMVEYLREEGLGEEDVRKIVAATSRPVTVYTPREKPVTLPFGATVLDFAHAIHRDVFHHAVSARVNGRRAELSQVLHDGDTVLIETREQAHPRIDWVEQVHGETAYTLRKYLRKRKKGIIYDDALGVLHRESMRYYIPARDLIRTALFHKFVSSYSFRGLVRFGRRLEIAEERYNRLRKRDNRTQIQEQLLRDAAVVVRTLKKEMVRRKGIEFLRQLGSGELKAGEVFAQIQKLYFKELMRKKAKVEKMREKIGGLEASGENPELLGKLKSRYRKLTAPYWIEVDTGVPPEQSRGEIGMLDKYVDAFSSLRFSLDDYLSADEAATHLVFAVNVFGGRTGGGIPGQIQRLIVRTVAAKSGGSVKVIRDRRRIEEILGQKRRAVRFV